MRSKYVCFTSLVICDCMLLGFIHKHHSNITLFADISALPH